MKTALILIGGLILLGGFGLLKQGRGGKMTQQGCGASIIGCILLIIGMMISPAADNSEDVPTVTDDEVIPITRTCSKSSLIGVIPSAGRHKGSQRWHLVGL